MHRHIRRVHQQIHQHRSDVVEHHYGVMPQDELSVLIIDRC